MKRLCLLASLLYGSVSFAQSVVPKLDQDGRKGEVARMQAEKAMKRFDALDTDKDGRLSKAEVKDVPYLVDGFDRQDKNRDGFLSWEEYVGHDRWPKEPRKE